jgi:hypothetical protein
MKLKTTMKTFTFFWIILLMLSNSITAQQKVQFFTTTTSSYCKGIAPMPGEYEKYYTPVSYKTTIYLYATDDKNFGKEFVIQSGDKITINEGEYFVSFEKLKNDIELKKRTATSISPTNKPVDNVKKNAQHININADMKSVTINYHIYCAWELDPNISPAP